MKEGVLKNFTKLIGEHQCRSLFFNTFFSERLRSTASERLAHVTLGPGCYL